MSTQAVAAVFRHSRSKAAARLVLLAMADEANDQGLLTAYRRSQRHLAGKANVDTGTVGRAAKTLVELGELEILQPGNGRASTDYRILLPGLEADAEGRQPAAPGPAPRPPTPGAPPTQAPQDAPPISPLLPGVAPSPPTPPSADPLAGFEEFWRAYPRRVAKGAARTAWPAAVKAAGGYTPIVEGARRLAVDPNRVDEFTPHPATWLRAERWDDPPLPPRPRINGRPPPGPNRLSPSNDALLRQHQPQGDDF